jgi:succinate dehydrogenase / fumarate reductase flavoprotein subunit
MKIFPGVHYTMGGLWVGYEPNGQGGLSLGSPRNQQTNIPGLYAIGECEYQYHGANRLGANSLVACIFSGLTVAPGIINYLGSFNGKKSEELGSALFDQAKRKHKNYYDSLLQRPQGGPNPYKLHAELGRIMTRSATVVRHNDDMKDAYAKVCELQQQAARCSISDTSAWANPTAPFARALEDMFPVAKAILQGAIARDESRGAHYKPEFSLPEIAATDPAGRRREAEAWVDHFEANNRKWLKSTIAACGPGGEPSLSYEDVDTRLIPPRPRLYGVAGGDMIEQVYKERQTAKK